MAGKLFPMPTKIRLVGGCVFSSLPTLISPRRPRAAMPTGVRPRPSRGAPGPLSGGLYFNTKYTTPCPPRHVHGSPLGPMVFDAGPVPSRYVSGRGTVAYFPVLKGRDMAQIATLEPLRANLAKSNPLTWHSKSIVAAPSGDEMR